MNEEDRAKLLSICSDIGYEIGSALIPKNKSDRFSALTDLNDLELRLRHANAGEDLLTLVRGVILAIEK
jgi:hypothetical protein